jgi:peptidoglycan/LPS O-acetylase OafA/YrhL
MSDLPAPATLIFTAMRDSAKKIYYLDGIRGVAAFLVMLHHFGLAFFPAVFTLETSKAHMRNAREVAFGDSVFSVLVNGNFCVCIFFVLSGFVLSRQYFLSARHETLVAATLRRFLRLYVPVAAAILIGYLLMKASWFYNVPVSTVAHSEWWMGAYWVTEHPELRLFQSLTYSTMFQGDNFWDNPLWTISIEFFGSLLVFAFLALTHNIRNRRFVMAVLLLYFFFFGYYYYTAFMLGIVLHEVDGRKIRSPFWGTLVSGLLMVTGLLMGADSRMRDWFPWSVATTPNQEFVVNHVLGSTLLMLSVLISPRLRWLFSTRIARFLGRISFSLYLIHALVICSLGCWLFLQFYWTLGYTRATGIALLGSLAVTIPLSWAMTRFVDDQGVRLSKYVYQRWFKKGQGDGAEPMVSDANRQAAP